MMNDLIFSVINGIGLITLNRQNALNALTHEMIINLGNQLSLWDKDDNIHAVVIQAAEGRAFCAGGDIRSLYAQGRKNKEAPLAFFRDEYRLNYQIYTYKKPYISLLNGLTFGGGVGISLHGRYNMATEHFVFAMPETSIGFFPDVGASYLLTRLQNGYGTYLGLTGKWVDASLAHALGLIQYYIPSQRLPQILNELIQLDLSNNPHAIVKAFLNPYQTVTKDSSCDESEKIKHYFDQKKTVLDIIILLKNEANPWTEEILKTLLQKSPMSLSVTFEQLNRAKNQSLATCLFMDYGLTYHFMHHSDFFEGVRAMLIDKDKNPKWSPSTLQAINIEQVKAFFSPLPETLYPLDLNDLKVQ